jgi:hypothetical protein
MFPTINTNWSPVNLFPTYGMQSFLIEGAVGPANARAFAPNALGSREP